MGRMKTDLIREWGPPMHVEPDGQGGEVLYYSRASGYTRSQIWMYANRSGKLYYWRTRER
jgi:hypothetical protein